MSKPPKLDFKALTAGLASAVNGEPTEPVARKAVRKAPAEPTSQKPEQHLDNRDNRDNRDNKDNATPRTTRHQDLPPASGGTIDDTLAYVAALSACGLPDEELVADVIAEISARHPGHAAAAERLIRRAPAGRLNAVLTAFLKGLAKAGKAEAKAEAKRIYNRDRNRLLRGSNNATTLTTATTRQSAQH
jgi:hypothetical protein